jgi:DNA-binding CsgD family transcriptional regulator
MPKSIAVYLLSRRLYWLPLLVLMLCLTSGLHAQYRQLLHKTFAQRQELLAAFCLEDLPKKDSLTLFKQINQIRKLATDNQDEDLLLETQLLRAGYFYYRNNQYPAGRILALLDSIRQEGKQKKKIWLEVMAENMEALFNFYEVQNYELAFEHHQRVYNLIKHLDPKDFPHKQNCLYQIAGEHYFFNNFREAIFYNTQALQAAPPHLLSPFYQPQTIMNTLGLSYQKLGMLDSADYYFNKTIAMARAGRLDKWDGIASGNLGYDFFLRKEYAKATPLLQRDVNFAVKYMDWSLASGSQMALTSISLLGGRLTIAGARLSLARKYVGRSGQYRRFEQLYPLMAKYYSLTHQPILAVKYLDSSLFIKDSLDRKFSALLLLRASQKIDLEHHRAEIGKIQAQKTINILQRNILLIVVVLTMVITVLVYHTQRKKVHLQKEQVLNARKELDDAAKQLNDFTRNIFEKNALIKLLEQQSNPNDEALWQLQQSTILTDADWAYFKGLFERAHNGYLYRLNEKLPELTPAEIRYMVLSKLNLSAREMAAMLGVGTDAIRQCRSRLRKKLDLGTDDSLEEVALQI